VVTTDPALIRPLPAGAGGGHPRVHEVVVHRSETL